MTTVTGEPFQPVRLYYTIPGKPFVTRTLSQLRCPSLPGAKTQEEKRRAFEQYDEDKRRERRDIPLAEDFPLAPEEETPEVMDLAMTLRLRSLRALPTSASGPTPRARR